MKDLAEMQELVYGVNKQQGRFDVPRTFAEDMALLHSEVSEALEAWRTAGSEDLTPPTPDAKPEGVGSEFADVLIRLLDSCKRYGIDLEKEFDRKLKYNAKRGKRHGGKAL